MSAINFGSGSSNAFETYAKLATVVAQLTANALQARAEGRKLAQAAGVSPEELDRLDAEADLRFAQPLDDPLAGDAADPRTDRL